MGIKNFVLSCPDYRIVGNIGEIIGHDEFYLFTIMGSSLGVLQNQMWMDVLIEHLDFMIERNPIERLFIIDHIDCKYYQYVFHDHDQIDDHRTNLNELVEILSAAYPDLQIIPKLISDIDRTSCVDCL
jgi:hypothetical protein